MIDSLLPLNSVPSLPWLPARRGGGKLSLATLWRWTIKGVGGVKLRMVRVGAQPCTTEEWLREFFEALANRDQQAAPVVRSPARREREIAGAQERLAAQGIS